LITRGLNPLFDRNLKGENNEINNSTMPNWGQTKKLEEQNLGFITPYKKGKP